jgi:hypothetical protein
MASANPNTVVLKADFPSYRTTIANGALTPGELINLDSAGHAIPHGGSALTALKRFAVEDAQNGVAIGTAYADNDSIQYIHAKPGDEIYAFLKASSAAVVIGSYVDSAGDGSLEKVDTDAASDDTQRSSIVGQAIEAVTPGGSDTRCRIVVI